MHGLYGQIISCCNRNKIRGTAVSIILLFNLQIFYGCSAPEKDTPVAETVEEQEQEVDIDPGYDRYFGSLRYEGQATGFFRTEQIDGRWWLMTPEGHPFFSNGINGIRMSGTATADGVKHYEQAAVEIYGDIETWADRQYDRFFDWGINSIGSWSDWREFQDRVPYTVILGVGGADWLTGDLEDYFDEGFRIAARAKFEEVAGPLVDDPYLIGYFLDNEMRWGPDWRGGHLFDDYMAATTEPTPTGKVALIDLLKQRYGTIVSLKHDFTTGIDSWPELTGETELAMRDTQGAIDTRSAWTGEVAERFFMVLSEELAAVDGNHLNLGIRFVSQLTPRAAIAAAGRYVDVMSINFYDLLGNLEEQLHLMDPDYLAIDDFLVEHYNACGKPILISEWGYRAADSGLPNTWPPLYPVLLDQAERADAYEQYMMEVLEREWFVGAHWFIYIDQPAEGRFDGENNNFGLINEQDEPYTELVERMAAVYSTIYTRLPKTTDTD
jgi:hypothetical protein